MSASKARLKGGLKGKILILVAIPLCFEVLVASTLMYFQHEYVKSVEDETTRKVVIYKTNKLWRMSVNMMLDNFALTFAVKADSESHWIRDYNTVLVQYTQLRQLMVSDEQVHLLDSLKGYIDKIHTLTKPPDKGISLSSAGPENLTDVLKSLRTVKRMVRASLQMGKAFRQFKEPLVEQSKAAEHEIDGKRQTVESVLIFAILGSVGVAAFLFGYFIRAIYGEIRALTNNIELFKAGKVLIPVTGSGDELALLHRRFHETAKALQETQRTKRLFVNTISQYLREPLNRVLAFVADLATNPIHHLDNKTVDGAKRSEKSLQRLIMLLDDLLALNEKVKAELDVAPRPVALRELVSSSVDAMSISGASNRIEVDVADDIQVLADSARIVQVIVNLLSNAIKFSPRHATVTVSAVRRGEFVEVRVKDSGRGIPKEKLDKVFERFGQVEATDGTQKGGTGLGLPICKHIVERHGGEIGVESEFGQGAMFWFRLRASNGAEAQERG